MELPQGESGSLYAVSVFTSVFYFMLSEGRVDKASVSALKMAHLNYKGFVCGDSVVKRIIYLGESRILHIQVFQLS